MKKIFLSVLIVLVSCNAQSHAKPDIKKDTFYKILGYLKSNQIDSIKKYVIVDDTSFFAYNVRCGNTIMKEQSEPNIDSIKLLDSTDVNGIEVYKYNLNFYKGDSSAGNIEMRFLNDTAIAQLFCHPPVNIVVDVDTNAILESLKKK